MNAMHVLAIAAALGVTCAAAKESGTIDPALKLAKSQASDVAVWTQVADGFYEGTASDGAKVSVYSGDEGARLMLSGIRRELLVSRNELDAATQANDSAKASAFLDEVVLLEAELKRLEELLAHNAHRSAAKANQEFHGTTGLFCGKDTATYARFSNFGTAPDTPSAAGRFGPFGGASPGTPASVYRQVFTRVESNGVPVTHQAASYVLSQTVFSSALKDVDLACFMRVRHAMTVQCVTGGPLDAFGITREQTCAGLTAGNPPVVFP